MSEKSKLISDILKTQKEKDVLIKDIEKKQLQNKPKRFGKGFVRNIGQGSFLKYSDDIESAIKTIVGDKSFAENQIDILKEIENYGKAYPKTALATEIISSIPTMVVLTLVSRGKINPMTVKGSAGLGFIAGTGATQKKENFTETILDMLADGSISGIAAAAITKGANAIGGSQVAQKLKKEIPITLGGFIGKGAKKVEESLKSIPFVGSAVRERELEALNKFNINIYNRVLEPFNKTLPKDKDGFDAYEYVSKTISDAYDNLTPRLSMTQKTIDDMIIELEDISDYFPEDVGNDFLKTSLSLIKKYQGRKGGFSGENLKKLQSNINQITNMGIGGNSKEQTKGFAMTEFQGILNKNILKDNPTAGTELSKINLAYRRKLPIQRSVVTSPIDNKGVFTPASFNNSLKFGNKIQKEKFAKGKAGESLQTPLEKVLKLPNFQTYARDTQDILGNTLADSGTPYRQVITNLLPVASAIGETAVTSGVPVGTLLGLTGLRGLYSKTGQRGAVNTLDLLGQNVPKISPITGGLLTVGDIEEENN